MPPLVISFVYFVHLRNGLGMEVAVCYYWVFVTTTRISRPWIGCCYQLKRLIRNMIIVQTHVLIWYPWDKLACIKWISNVQPFQCHDNLSRCLSFFLNFISLLQSLYSRLVNIFYHSTTSDSIKARKSYASKKPLWTFVPLDIFPKPLKINFFAPRQQDCFAQYRGWGAINLWPR